MRTIVRVCAALLSLSISVSAKSTIYVNVGINGSLAGATTTVMCNSGSPVSCFTDYPGGLVTTPYTEPFNVALGIMALEEGDNAFSYGSPYSFGSFSGIINDAGGVLTGRDLQYSRVDSSCHSGSVGCQSVFATAPAFNVTGGVPEPRTWLLMVIGFGLMGVSLRRSSKLLGTAKEREYHQTS